VASRRKCCRHVWFRSAFSYGRTSCPSERVATDSRAPLVCQHWRGQIIERQPIYPCAKRASYFRIMHGDDEARHTQCGYSQSSPHASQVIRHILSGHTLSNDNPLVGRSQFSGSLLFLLQRKGNALQLHSSHVASEPLHAPLATCQYLPYITISTHTRCYTTHAGMLHSEAPILHMLQSTACIHHMPPASSPHITCRSQ
jgi:hypothetical protein